MRRYVAVFVSAVVVVVMMASVVQAATVSVNAARNTYANDSSRYCGVIVDDYLDYVVNVYCFGSGSTWFKVKVPGVGGKITAVRTAQKGDCSGKTLSWTRSKTKWSTLLVKVKNTGDFDCNYKAVSVDFKRSAA